jgi:hypothetical protein
MKCGKYSGVFLANETGDIKIAGFLGVLVMGSRQLLVGLSAFLRII